MTTIRRVAALYDIHGNLPALEAVLKAVEEERVDQIIIGGDVFPGPMGVESLELLMSLSTPVTCICGNGDRETLAARDGTMSATLPPSVQSALRWCGAQLADSIAQHVRLWPATTTLHVDGLGEVLFCHATPDDDTTIITERTSAADVIRHFGAATADTIVCGHTHMQYDRQIGTTRLVNAGSVGMPFGAPGADWLLLGPGITLRHLSYDLASAATRVRRSPYPDAESFAASSILRPPSAASMLEKFSPRA